MRKYSAPTFLKVLMIAGVVLFFGLGILLLVDPEAALADRLAGLLMSGGALALLFFMNNPLGTIRIDDAGLHQQGLVWGDAQLAWAEVAAGATDLGAAIPRLSNDRRTHRIGIFPLLTDFEELLAIIRRERPDLWTFPQAMMFYANGWTYATYSGILLISFALAGLAALERSGLAAILVPGLISAGMLALLIRIPLRIEIAPDSIVFHRLAGTKDLEWQAIERIRLAEEVRSVTSRKKVEIDTTDGNTVVLGGDLGRNVHYLFEYLQAWHGRS